MTPISNEDLISRCNIQLKQNAAEIASLRKQAATVARSSRTAAVVAQAARDATPITSRGADRSSPFALPIAREMLKMQAGAEYHGERITAIAKAAKKAAKDDDPASLGSAIKQHLLDMADDLKQNYGMTDSHPAVQNLQMAAQSYGDPDDDSTDPGEAAEGVAKAVAGYVTALRETAVAKNTQRGTSRFSMEAFIPGATGSTRRMIKGGFENGGQA